MALISFLTGFATVAVHQKKHKIVNIKNRIIGGCITGLSCTIIHSLLLYF